MSTDGIDALLGKREELLAQVQGIPSAIFHVDQALSLIGDSTKVVARRFANRELMRLIGEAERAGNQTPTGIMQYVMAAKGMDGTDKKLCARILIRVKDCRKRMNAWRLKEEGRSGVKERPSLSRPGVGGTEGPTSLSRLAGPDREAA